MTNNMKMPVVGERYRPKGKSSYDWAEFKRFSLLNGGEVIFCDLRQFLNDGESNGYVSCPLLDFWNRFELKDPISQPSIPVKEERLPEGGRRYRYKSDNLETVYVDQLCGRMVDYVDSQGKVRRKSLESFWGLFEEIPNNSQKPHCIYGSDSCERCPPKSQKPTVTFQTPDDLSLGFNSPTWSDVESKQDKVQKAKDELKTLLKTIPSYRSWDFAQLKYKAQALLNALDEGEKERLNIVLPSASIGREFYFNCQNPGGTRITARTESIYVDGKEIKPNEMALYTPDEKGGWKLEIKKIEEKPKSIWQDVSELPEETEWVLLKLENDNIVLSMAQNKAPISFEGRALAIGGIKCFARFTNFINAFEAQESRIEGLEQRIKQLEGK